MHDSSVTRSPQLFAASGSPDSGSTPLLVGIEEVARLLNVSSRTVWTLTVSGSLPHLRIGRRVLYPVDAVRRWTAERTQGGGTT